MTGLIVGIYYGALTCLSLLGLHRLYLVVLARKKQPTAIGAPEIEPEVPFVTVQLPIFNERFVVRRLLEAAANLDYPQDRVEIQVLDDSTDETTSMAAEAVSRLQKQGTRIVHLRRPHREGFKAGALAEGLRSAKGEFIAIFDADFVPSRDFLKRTLPSFRDSTVGMAQARWGHLNANESLLTRVQALMIDGHFAVEQAARSHAGLFFNFNGTAGVWRRKAIEEAGGWQPDTLTEDLDLSYRTQLAGWRFVYLPDVSVPAELPADLSAFRTQQRRWCKGSAQTARKILPRVWRSPVSLERKIESVFHLTGNWAYLLIFLLIVTAPFAVLSRGFRPDSDLRTADWLLFTLPMVSLAIFFVFSRRGSDESMVTRLAQLPLLVVVGVAIAANNTVAVIEGIWGSQTPFVRTPKRGDERLGDQRVYALKAGLSSWLETALVLYLGGVVILLVKDGRWGALPFVTLFASGYLYVTVLTVRALFQNRKTHPMATGA